jgi:hypothetical protein
VNRFAVTMGVQYRHEPHPDLPADLANPDGYLLVQAENESDARKIIDAVIGSHWAFIYPEDELLASPHYQRYHPLGCLGEIFVGVLRPGVLPPTASVEAYRHAG